VFLGSFDNFRLFSSLVFAFSVGFLLLVLPNLFVPKTVEMEKLSPYECGFEPFSEKEIEMEVRFLSCFDFIYNF